MCLVSIIIPYYNSEKTIIRALNSVKGQIFKNYEIILVDDGSNDKSYKIVENFKTNNVNINVRNLKQCNQGPSVARNNAIKASRGQYIAFLDSDDEWLENKLEKQVSLMDNDNMDLLGCSYNIHKNDKINKWLFTNKPLKKMSFYNLLFKHYFTPSCVMIRRDVLNNIGLFDEKQKYMEDSLLFTKIARKYNCYISCDCLVNSYKLPYGDNGLSERIYSMEKFELLNFKRLRRENKSSNRKIGLLLYSIMVTFSILKFIRRNIIVNLRKKL